MKKRDQSIDIMRLIWLLLIILAHTISPQTLIFQLRNFDVPMMVVISGMSFFLSNNNRKIDLKWYYIKRIVRLILPTWVFLSIFFIITYLINYITWNNFLFEWKIIWTFLLFQWATSIWYVWIIRVFLLVALINPLLYKIYNKFNKVIFILILLIIYIIYSLLINYFPFSWKNIGDIFIHQYIYYLIPYWILSGFWILLVNLKLKNRLIWIWLLFSILIWILFSKYWLDNFKFFPQDFKYPARDYYLIWWLFISFLISTVFIKINLKWFFKSILEFFSSFSLWLYFWHIIILTIINSNLNINNWYKKFIIVLFITIIIMYIHKRFFNYILKFFKKKTQKNIKILFLT